MVAIVGGLLVARYVAIASEQEGTDRLLSDVRARLARAVIQARGAQDLLRGWDVIDFFEAKIIHAIGEGEQDVHALRKIGDPHLADEELTDVVQEITEEFTKARSTLPRLPGRLPAASRPGQGNGNRCEPLPIIPPNDDVPSAPVLIV
jgi:hypothetical protein